MDPFRVVVARAVRGLSRPSRRANLKGLWSRSESLDSVTVRDAGPDDVPTLAELHVTTWNAAHRVRAGGGPTVAIRATQWRDKLSASDAGNFCVVVEQVDHGMIGFASGKPGDYPGFEGQLTKIYLLRQYQRLGLGRLLMCHAARRFLEQGIDSMMLFSYAENPSCGFFEAMKGERLLSDKGEFHGAYGWRTLHEMATACLGEAQSPDTSV